MAVTGHLPKDMRQLFTSTSLVLAGCILLASAAGCGRAEHRSLTQIEAREVSNATFSVARQFGPRLRPNKNGLVFSPFGIFALVAALDTGARGATLRQLEKAGGIDESRSPGEIAQSYADALNAWRDSAADGDVISSQTALWISPVYTPTQKFVSTIRDQFAGQVFNDAPTPQQVADWIAKSNDGPPVQFTLPPDVEAIALNATSFRARWIDEFKSALTMIQQFHGALHDAPVSMMHRGFEAEYNEGDFGQAVEVPMHSGVSMWILLPRHFDKNTAMLKLIDVVSSNSLAGWHVNLAIPRFSVQMQNGLTFPLRQMGITAPLGDQTADFTGVFGRSHVAFFDWGQNVSFKVDERGASATALTYAERPEMLALSSRRTANMTVDKPFAFAITVSQTDAILFAGYITQL